MHAVLAKLGWKIVGGAATAAAAAVAKGALQVGYRRLRRADPPGEPGAARPQAPLLDSVAWAAASAGGVALSRLIAARGAAAGWRKIAGTPPPGAEAETAGAVPQG